MGNRDRYDEVQRKKQQVDAPKESPIIAVLLFTLLATVVVHQVKGQSGKQHRERLLTIQAIRSNIKKKFPALFADDSSGKKKKKAKEKKEFEDRAFTKISDADLVKAAKELSIDLQGFTGKHTSLSDAFMMVIKAPMNMFA